MVAINARGPEEVVDNIQKALLIIDIHRSTKISESFHPVSSRSMKYTLIHC